MFIPAYNRQNGLSKLSHNMDTFLEFQLEAA